MTLNEILIADENRQTLRGKKGKLTAVSWAELQEEDQFQKIKFIPFTYNGVLNQIWTISNKSRWLKLDTQWIGKKI